MNVFRDVLNLKPRVEPHLLDASVLVIRLIGLATIAEKYTPTAMIEHMGRLMLRLAKTVADFGGRLDVHATGGFLCTFSDKGSHQHAHGHHPDRAFMCAMRIQKDNVLAVIQAGRAGEPTLCLRIGAHCGRIFHGNLPAGGGAMTIGKCVDVADTIVEQCDAHSITLSREMYDLFLNADNRARTVKPRLLAMRNEMKEMPGLEYDPLESDGQMRRTANEALRACSSQVRVDRRWPVSMPDSLLVTTSNGMAELRNFSRGGLALVMRSPLPVGSIITISIDTPQGTLKDRLVRRSLYTIKAEVRVNTVYEGRFVSGVAYRDLQAEQMEFLLSLLLETQGQSIYSAA